MFKKFRSSDEACEAKDGKEVHTIVVLGARGVGKTSLTGPFVSETWQDGYNPTVEDAFRKKVTVNGSEYILDMYYLIRIQCDAVGTTEHLEINIRGYQMRERQGFVLVYDVTNPASVDYVTRLHDEILQNKSDGNTDAPTVIPTVLVGNKVDLRTKKSVSHYRGEQLSEKLECPFYETSAIENINTDVVFHDVVRQIIDMKEMFRRMKLKVVRGRLEVV